MMPFEGQLYCFDTCLEVAESKVNTRQKEKMIKGMFENENPIKYQGHNILVGMHRFFIRSKTNAGELAKQSFKVIISDTAEPALIIRKLVLTDNFRLYKGFNLLKIHKGRGLFEQRFSIKLSTLKTVFNALSVYNKNNL